MDGGAKWRTGAWVGVLVVLLAGCSYADDTTSAPTAPPSASAGTTPGSVGSHAASPVPTADATSPTPPPRRTKPVPAPSGGDISEVVAPHVVPTARAVALTDKASITKGVSVVIRSVKPLKVGAAGPGEIAGEALAVTVVVDNRSAKALDLTSAVVTAVRDDGSPLLPTTSGPYAALAAKVAPGSATSATYVFLLNPPVDGDIHVFVSCTPALATAEFAGPVA